MGEMHDQADQAGRDVKREQWHRMPAWKKTLLAVSIACMVAGAVMSIAGGAWGPKRAEARSGEVGSATSTSSERSSAGGTSGSGAPVRGFVSTSKSGSEKTSDPAPSSIENSEPETDATPQSRIAAWSPALFKLGFSFFVGFCIAYALRLFLKMAVLALGVIFLGAFALQYFGLVNINWHLLGGHYDSATQWLSSQFASFERFVTGQLPSAASAGAGLLVGFKR